MKIGLPKLKYHMARLRQGAIPARGPHSDHRRRQSLAGDSTGYSDNRVRWFSIRHDQVRLKRGWVKLAS